jgi:parallel beta-helix repeat protein
VKSASIVVLLLLSSVVFVSLPPIKAESKTIVVPDDYATIQEAIDNAAEGDTVYVESGVYIENLVINKFISLIGKNKDTTIIYCNDNIHPTVLVSKNGVNITGFTIQNNVPSPSNTRGGLAAFHLLHVSYCNIYQNIMVTSGYGVWLYSSHYNNIFDNTIKNTNYGIFVEFSLNNTITRNTASKGWNGIWLQTSSNNILRNNNMTDNYCDFAVSGTELLHYYNDVDKSNLVNGKRIYYLIDQENMEISSSFFPDLGLLVLVNCRGITVKNLNIVDNFFGILLFNTLNSTITNNYIGNNKKGIWLKSSNSITIYNNNLDSNSDDGIRLENSKNILVRNNTVQKTGFNGIYLGGGSDNNYIIENIMTENGNNAINLESSSNNTIINNEVSNSYFAVRLYTSTYNKIETNRINSPKSENVNLMHCYQGVVIDHHSDNNIIVRNVISNNL